MTERDNSDFDFFAWRDRMRMYAEDRVPTDVKIQIAHNVIRTQMPNSTPEDATLYFDPEFQPNAQELDKSIRYGQIENELRMLFYGTIKQEEWERRAKKHHEGIMPILIQNFTSDEITDFLMGIQAEDITLDTSAAIWIVGGESLWGRRIRNAYIPSIVSLLSVDPNTGNYEDISHNLFDNNLDAVDALKKLLGNGQ